MPAPARSQSQEKTEMADATRLVKVFIVDPNANLPLETRLIYGGDEKITDPNGDLRLLDHTTGTKITLLIAAQRLIKRKTVVFHLLPL
jgi:hypothetical protein